MNNKKELLNLALSALKNIEVEKVETVDIDSTTYDDGSCRLTISIDYPECKDNEQKTYQNGVTITVFKEDTNELIVSLVMDSKGDTPFCTGDMIEKNGYKTTIEPISKC